MSLGVKIDALSSLKDHSENGIPGMFLPWGIWKVIGGFTVEDSTSFFIPLMKWCLHLDYKRQATSFQVQGHTVKQ